MPSAKVINFPRAFRRRPPSPEPARFIIRPYSHPDASAFGLLLLVTIVGAFLYLSGTVHVARHDALYAALLVLVWGVYFTSDKLLRTRFGPMLMRIGRFLLLVGVAGFFGGVYWLIYRNG